MNCAIAGTWLCKKGFPTVLVPFRKFNLKSLSLISLLLLVLLGVQVTVKVANGMGCIYFIFTSSDVPCYCSF